MATMGSFASLRMTTKMTKEKTQTKDDKAKVLENAIAEIKERFGEGSIMKLGEIKRVDVEAISTGSVSLDIALGVGGMPKGRIIELYGPESSGKSTICLQTAAQAQKKGGMVAFIDAEARFVCKRLLRLRKKAGW